MSKHTPGPWKLGNTALIEDAEGNAFAGAYWDDEDIPEEVAIANAQLMAAAPDLLEALKETLAIAARDEFGAYVQRAEAAIAKAEGRT